jgi:hypothetical protein
LVTLPRQVGVPKSVTAIQQRVQKKKKIMHKETKDLEGAVPVLEVSPV